MSKDGTNRGGARIGAGRKRKPLAQKILEGSVDKHKTKVLDFGEQDELVGVEMPPPREYLSSKQHGGGDIIAVEVYEKTWNWLKERNCAHLIPPQIIEQYAMAISRYIQCEEGMSRYGFLAKHPTTGNPMTSPYVTMSQTFGKRADNIWHQIYHIVIANCATDFKTSETPHADVMERLLRLRGG